MALSIGLEPTTDRLTADCSAIELAERVALLRVTNNRHGRVGLQPYFYISARFSNKKEILVNFFKDLDLNYSRL